MIRGSDTSTLGDGTLTLRVSRRFAAPRARVFAAWTEADRLERWFGPRGYSTTRAEVDLRPGGAYRITMRAPDGKVVEVTGTFQHVEPPHRVAYTWQYEPDEITLVTVEFVERGRETEVVLVHEKFRKLHTLGSHDAGWNGCFDHLDAFLRAEVRSRSPRTPERAGGSAESRRAELRSNLRSLGLSRGVGKTPPKGGLC